MTERRVEIAPHVQFVRVEGDYVLMNIKGGVYMGLDSVASRIWQSLAEHGDLMRAAEDLCQDYDTTHETALADIERWVAELEKKGLVHPVEPEAAP